jgi:hypothetical protein
MISSGKGQSSRVALWIGAGGLAAAIFLGWMDPHALATAYRYGVFCCLQPALGCLIFLLIYRSTGGHWGEMLQPVLVAGARLVPWIWLLVIPLVWLAPLGRAESDHLTHAVKRYLAPEWVLMRSALWAVLFFVFRWLATPVAGSGALRLRGDRFAGFGPVGLIVLTFSLHLLAVDWLFALDPGWFSTAFPLIWMAGQALMGMALAIVVGIGLGLDPHTQGKQGRPVGIEWGNLLLTSTIFWAYVSFMQFLIIWSGNIEREVTWYLARSHGGWRWVAVSIAVLNLVFPFFLLLSRSLKTRPRALAGIAALLLLSQLLYTAWLILPALPGPGWRGGLLDVAVLIAAGALFFNRVVSGAHSLRSLP